MSYKCNTVNNLGDARLIDLANKLKIDVLDNELLNYERLVDSSLSSYNSTDVNNSSKDTSSEI